MPSCVFFPSRVCAGQGVGLILVGLVVRLSVSFVVVLGNHFRWAEVVFVAVAWLPKATVQVRREVQGSIIGKHWDGLGTAGGVWGSGRGWVALGGVGSNGRGWVALGGAGQHWEQSEGLGSTGKLGAVGGAGQYWEGLGAVGGAGQYWEGLGAVGGQHWRELGNWSSKLEKLFSSAVSKCLKLM